MEFRVYEIATNRDVTDDAEWYIDTDGDLRFMIDTIAFPSNPLAIADSRKYYYKIEMKVVLTN